MPSELKIICILFFFNYYIPIPMVKIVTKFISLIIRKWLLQLRNLLALARPNLLKHVNVKVATVNVIVANDENVLVNENANVAAIATKNFQKNKKVNNQSFLDDQLLTLRIKLYLTMGKNQVLLFKI